MFCLEDRKAPVGDDDQSIARNRAKALKVQGAGLATAGLGARAGSLVQPRGDEAGAGIAMPVSAKPRIGDDMPKMRLG